MNGHLGKSSRNRSASVEPAQKRIDAPKRGSGRLKMNDAGRTNMAMDHQAKEAVRACGQNRSGVLEINPGKRIIP